MKKDLALGSYEAACVLGVHWTQPKKMADKGLLTTRAMKSPLVNRPANVFKIYSLDECEKDFLDYQDTMANGGTGKRPRSGVDKRPGMLKKLAALKHPIEFGDAVSPAEAGKILGVHWTFAARMAQDGKIVGRVLHNDRKSAGRLWIFSRSSCEANASLARRLEAAGKKKGRKRKPA